ncbi:MAG: precorrin-2 C(20)-methyltransferase [Rhodospirillales bacterium]|jgi:precorrin-2/cobalt-factor-2 C20-methyltransferase|nr:precorrin-2 C(20)-methyltransferase [Rhodospirillales bacterium]MDP6884163.1 precorrin-2 C(20)-methyltransferase [Rhodospirillales bacterium]
MTATGTFYGLGVGPGDPDLITVKALKTLRAVPVVAYPAPSDGDSLARSIVAPHMTEGQIEIAIRIPIMAQSFPDRDVYDRAAAEIAGHLAAGRDVAAICEGDPFFYGSFMYLFERVVADYPVEVVPGVSSIMACSAALGAPLAARNDVLCIIPAPLEEAELKSRLERTDAAAIIKIGRHFAKVRRVLGRLGMTGRARYVEHATMTSQRIMALDEVDEASAPYFSMVLVHQRGEAWR